MKYHQEKQQNAMKAEREEANRLKRIAGSMGKMVREFWSNIEKVNVCYLAILITATHSF